MNFDLNTIISTAVLGLSGWTLYTVHRIETKAAARDEHAKGQDMRIDENRARIIACEDDVKDLQISVARINPHHK